MFNRTSEYLDAANRGVAARLGSTFQLELRTGEPSPSDGDVPLEPHGDLLRVFVVENAARIDAPGVMELVESSIMSVGPRGVVGHVRLVAGDGTSLAEGSVANARDRAEFEERSKDAALVLNMATLEVVEGQPIQLESFRIGGGVTIAKINTERTS